MQINSDAIIQDAQKLRASSEDLRSYKAGEQDARTAQASRRQIEFALDQMNVNLRTHQQTVARLQLETIGLDQIERNLNFILKSNPEAFEEFKRVVTEMQSAVEATRYQQQSLIPQNLRDAIYGDLNLPGRALEAMQMLIQRREEIDKGLKYEFQQISRIQVSFENIQSLNMPLEGRAQSVVEELAKQLVTQQKLVQSPMDPNTVMNLLRA
jgi:hypothetical protein